MQLKYEYIHMTAKYCGTIFDEFTYFEKINPFSQPRIISVWYVNGKENIPGY
jgi:hypothetical protein